ncbi:hypothetical protein CPB85DRAFT_1432480 [Mucidula mucida]|nr:hypothetical protein CPB85DRAFT_1432480 [Mucidula mucida]
MLALRVLDEPVGDELCLALYTPVLGHRGLGARVPSLENQRRAKGAEPSMWAISLLTNFTSTTTLIAASVEGMEIFKGKTVIVVGAATSGAQSYLSACVYEVTLGGSSRTSAPIVIVMALTFQFSKRTSTYVFSTKNGFKYITDDLYLKSGLPTLSADLPNASFPNLLGTELSVRSVDALAEADNLVEVIKTRAPLLQFLTKKGGYYIGKLDE